MAPVEELLKPVSAESPCGEDLSYDPSFGELQTLVKGKAETQFSPAEGPDWKQVHEKAAGLFARSKDLRTAIVLCAAALKLEGLPGFARGMDLVRGMIERNWDAIYPRLDPDEGNDATERLNILGALNAPFGSFGDPYAFLDNLRRAPLAESARVGRFSFSDLKKSETEGSPQPAQISAAFQDTDVAVLQTKQSALQTARENLRAVDQFLTTTLGADRAPDLSNLSTLLEQMEKAMAAYLPSATLPAAATEAQVVPGAAGAPSGVDGAIRSRQDAVRALERICDYYAKNEPSSPLPFLLRRAQRLAEMDFLEAISELTPDAAEKLRTIMGVKPDAAK